MGGIAIASQKCVTNPQINSIVTNPNFNPNFIYYSILYNIDEFKKNAGTTTLPIINKTTFSRISLNFPSLSEQEKIASILSSVDEVLETTQRKIDKLQDLKKASMNELLSEGIGHKEFKESELGIIPKSWELGTLGDYFALTSGKSKLTRLLSSTMTKVHSIPVYGGNGVNGYTDSALLDKPTIVIGRVGKY